MSDELRAAWERVCASAGRVIKAELRSLNPGTTSPSRSYSAGKPRLTSSDPEPPAGTRVRDDCGQEWFNDGHRPCCWVMPDAEVHDPESWTKIAGNYGPVTVLVWGGGE